MRFVGAACLFLLGSLTVNGASGQYYHNDIDDFLYVSSPGSMFDEAAENLVNDPVFQVLPTKRQLELMEQLGSSHLANNNALPEDHTSNEGLGYTQGNEQRAIISQFTQGSGSMDSYYSAEDSGSGSGSGSLPFPAAQYFCTQVPMDQDSVRVQQPRVLQSNNMSSATVIGAVLLN
ncbi:hypothetical protein H4R33_002460 [Dimargaris cristalligena]|nr:hypothetical protein H4R33_002460 [Dimargaris cristalligena]